MGLDKTHNSQLIHNGQDADIEATHSQQKAHPQRESKGMLFFL